MRIDRALDPNPALTRPPEPGTKEPKGDFGQLLMDALEEVNKAQAESRSLQNDLMANRPVEFHDLMIAMERASTAMALTLQVRNKLLEAYQEVSRMQV
jgi:flagellar hook-basal body complex protein FliE